MICPSCPNCQSPQTAPMRSAIGGLALGLGIVSVIVGFVFLFILPPLGVLLWVAGLASSAILLVAGPMYYSRPNRINRMMCLVCFKQFVKFPKI